ncbi:Uncharacterised protein [Vibrio cholerae]|nr:Uncharacterised protein [Vibrio cholerae]
MNRASAYTRVQYHRCTDQPVASSWLFLDLKYHPLVVSSNARSTMKTP